MIAPVFSDEYSGVDNIILTSKYGRTKCGMAKVAASFIASLAVTILVTVFNLAFAILLYGFEGLDCFSILSEQQINGNILYAIWAVPIAMIFMMFGMIFSPRVFAKHQVS